MARGFLTVLSLNFPLFLFEHNGGDILNVIDYGNCFGFFPKFVRGRPLYHRRLRLEYFDSQFELRQRNGN